MKLYLVVSVLALLGACAQYSAGDSVNGSMSDHWRETIAKRQRVMF